MISKDDSIVIDWRANGLHLLLTSRGLLVNASPPGMAEIGCSLASPGLLLVRGVLWRL